MEPGKTALKQKFDELVGLLGYIVDLTGDGREVPEWLKEQISEIREMLATITPAEQDTAPAIVKTGDLWLLGLSSRPRGSLERYGVMTIDQAREKRDAELLKLKGLGYKSLKEIRQKIAIYDALSKNLGTLTAKLDQIKTLVSDWRAKWAGGKGTDPLRILEQILEILESKS